MSRHIHVHIHDAVGGAGRWEEGEHPRDETGQFTAGGMNAAQHRQAAAQVTAHQQKMGIRPGHQHWERTEQARSSHEAAAAGLEDAHKMLGRNNWTAARRRNEAEKYAASAREAAHTKPRAGEGRQGNQAAMGVAAALSEAASGKGKGWKPPVSGPWGQGAGYANPEQAKIHGRKP